MGGQEQCRHSTRVCGEDNVGKPRRNDCIRRLKIRQTAKPCGDTLFRPAGLVFVANAPDRRGRQRWGSASVRPAHGWTRAGQCRQTTQERLHPPTENPPDCKALRRHPLWIRRAADAVVPAWFADIVLPANERLAGSRAKRPAGLVFVANAPDRRGRQRWGSASVRPAHGPPDCKALRRHPLWIRRANDAAHRPAPHLWTA
jgi:hypothetical protein